jgi:hypothetical protein
MVAPKGIDLELVRLHRKFVMGPCRMPLLA